MVSMAPRAMDYILAEGASQGSQVLKILLPRNRRE